MVKFKIWVENSFEWVFIVALISFFARSAFPPLKFLFVCSFIVLLGTIFAKKIKFHLFLFKILTLPILALLIYLVAAFQSINTFVLKEAINCVIILLFYFIAINANIIRSSFFHKLSRFYIFLFFIIGLIGLIKFFLFSFYNFYPPSISYTSGFKSGTSLVDDYNFFALFFLIGIVILLTELTKPIKKGWLLFSSASIFLFSIIVLFSSSRRAAFMFLLVFIYTLILSIKNSWIRKTLIVFILGFVLTLVSVFIILKSDNVNPNKRVIVSQVIYRYINGVFIEETSFDNFYLNLWLRGNQKNLHYNSDFKQGQIFWKTTTSGVELSIVKTIHGNATRVNRVKGSGDFVLSYVGPQIILKKDVTYTYKFKYRIIQGEGVPFKVGWWIRENDIYLYDLEKKIVPLGSNWFECECSYTFLDTHASNEFNFLNSVLQNTVIDIADVRLLSSDSLQYNIKPFVGIKPKVEISGLNKPTSRTIRWNFAYNLWKTEYSWHQKLFGRGFRYLEWYGEKFFNDPKHYDYPHNPIISSFLYSGIIGGLIYIYFLGMVFWYYWKYRKYQMAFFIMYLVSFFFIMFSGNSHFSVPIFTFLSFVPFLTKYLVENELFK